MKLLSVLALAISFFFTGSVLATNRVYWDEAADTIYVSSFPARVDLHMRMDNADTLTAMVFPFTWSGSNGVDSLIRKSCDKSGWFKGSAVAFWDAKYCRFDSPDKQMVNCLRFSDLQFDSLPPGTNYLYTIWSFIVGQENAVLCMDSTLMTPSNRLKWTTRTNQNIYPEYTKKCWVIAKLHCGDANLDEVVDIGDMVYLINYIFYNGPNPVGNSDVNSDGVVDIGDIVYLMNYVFYGGPEPSC